jgi:hypothetical protein
MARGTVELQAESSWLSNVSSRAFFRIEVSACLVLGLRLARVALVGIVARRDLSEA